MSNPTAPEDLTPETLAECEQIMGYQFRDHTLLVRCLTHASAARTRLESNERIEFLGDAILGAAVCENLYEQFPTYAEGELTRIKSVVVSRTTCARVIRALQLEPYLVLGKGITNHLPTPNSVLATVFEAIIGGIYLDGGFHEARAFVIRHLEKYIDDAAGSVLGVNHKSLFQQRTQRTFGETPVYQVIDEQGPDHSKYFKVKAVVGDREFPSAWGDSKKAAEQRAAQNAIAELDGLPIPHADTEEANCHPEE